MKKDSSAEEEVLPPEDNPLAQLDARAEGWRQRFHHYQQAVEAFRGQQTQFRQTQSQWQQAHSSFEAWREALQHFRQQQLQRLQLPERFL